MMKTETKKRAGGIAAAAAFLSAIVAANYATSYWGMIPVGFGLTATAGTVLAGTLFILRDLVQDFSSRPRVAVVSLVAAGGLLSYLLAEPFIAVASLAAFVVSELVDWLIYTPLRERGYVRAAVASNTVGSFLDTVVFLWVAGFPIWVGVPGQMLVKVGLTVLTVAAVAVWRTRRVGLVVT